MLMFEPSSSILPPFHSSCQDFFYKCFKNIVKVSLLIKKNDFSFATLEQ